MEDLGKYNFQMVSILVRNFTESWAFCWKDTIDLMNEPQTAWTGDESRRLYETLSQIDRRPKPFSCYTAETLWNDSHISERMLAFDADRTFDLIVMIYCDFCALSPDQRKRLLSVFERCLAAEGRILLDVFSLNAFGARNEDFRIEYRLMDGFWSAADYYGFMHTFKYDREKVVLDKYTLVEAEKTWQVYNWLQYFRPAALEKEFEAAGLAAEAVYADVAGTPYAEDIREFAVVAKRR